MSKEEKNITQYLREDYGIELIAEDEEFQVIEGFSSYYMSNYGRVFSQKTGKVLKEQYNNSGYPFYRLMPDEGKDPITVVAHVCVYELFGDTNKEYEVVHHIDKIRSHMKISNLAGVTYKENNTYGKGKALFGMKDGDIGYFRSIQSAANLLNINRIQIYNCLYEKRKDYKGYTFKFADSDTSQKLEL